MKRITDFEVEEKRVLVRVDFNVELKDGEIADDTKIRGSLPTINYLIRNKARVIICSHLGRPKGERKPELSLRPLAERLGQLLGQQVKFAPDCIGEEVEKMAKELKPAEVLFLENLRFHPGEEGNDPLFAKTLSRLAELYVNDAFATCHRKHASIEAITNFLPHAAGFSLEREVKMLSYLLYTAEHPFALLLGGAKIDEKIGILENVLDKSDGVLIGGAICLTFLKSQGYSVGRALIAHDMLPICQRITSQKKGVFLPVDVLVAYKAGEGQKTWAVKVEEIPEDCLVVDIGPETVKLFLEELRRYKTIFWNGPMGIVEFPEFASGTLKIAEALSQTSSVVVVGGGSTSSFLFKRGLADKLTFVSMGGGALFQFLKGEKLPGIAALER